ncbi:MAG: hypothetical protein A3G87_10160 [Omnitrophica bacterium RIFCSPLOWO2_12_FULL_50_11]|nr:MAG: hypothetical protein A3G87_10160 [Omnitrophica bacterium RIFCSPLOWO2_12_FULL_50_11]
MKKITKADLEKFSLTMQIRAYRTVEKGRDPLIPSQGARRATWTNTAGLYCSLDEQTPRFETKDYLTNPVTYMIRFENSISIFDAEAYCETSGISETTFYAGMTSGTLGIHQLRGTNIQGAIWPSQKNSAGKSLVLYTENIPNYPQGFSTHKICPYFNALTFRGTSPP